MPIRMHDFTHKALLFSQRDERQDVVGAAHEHDNLRLRIFQPPKPLLLAQPPTVCYLFLNLFLFQLSRICGDANLIFVSDSKINAFRAVWFTKYMWDYLLVGNQLHHRICFPNFFDSLLICLLGQSQSILVKAL